MDAKTQWNLVDDTKIPFVEGLFDDDEHAVDATLSWKGLGCTRSAPPSKKGSKFVYAVLAKEPVPRAVGKSKVLYIGQGSASRMRDLLNNRHSATRALRILGEKLRRDVVVVWRRITNENSFSANSCLVESFLLHQVAAQHGELPPANRRWEGFFGGELLKAMMEHAHEAKIRGLSAYDWPADLDQRHPGEQIPDASAWCEYKNLALGWLWPKEWSGQTMYRFGEREVGAGRLVLAGRAGELKPWVLADSESRPLVP